MGISSRALALKAQGRASFTATTSFTARTSFTATTSFARSGGFTIGAGSALVTKTSIALGSASLVPATIQGSVAGVWVQGVAATTGSSGSFTIHLNKSTPANLTVGWFIVN